MPPSDMTKRCPACNGPLSDPAKQFCPACDKLGLRETTRIQIDHEHLALLISDNLKRDWRFIGKIIGVVSAIILVIIGVVDAIIGFSLKERMAQHFQSQETLTRSRITEHLATLDTETSNTLAQVEVQMRSNVAKHFEAPAIRATIEQVGKVQARGILEAEVRPAVSRFQEDALFIRTVARAQAYDFKAFQELLLTASPTNKNSDLAKQAVSEINRSLERLRSESAPKRVFMTVFGTNLYQGPFASDELAMWFSSTVQDPTTLNREGFVNTVRDLQQPLFLSSLIQLFTNETDLVVADTLAAAISDLAKEDFRPRDFHRLLAWWLERRDRYANWPFSTLERGMKEFSAVRYPQAAEAFDQVIKLDAGADMSRAYAIACYSETRQTNRAAVLAKEFKAPSGRWAQWARAKADLEAGNISNATVSFFHISTNFPTMPTAPDPNYHTYRHIDWQLFNNLKGTNGAPK